MKTSPIVFKALVEAGMGRIEGVLALEMVPNSLVTVMGDGMMEHRLESPRLSNDAAKAFFTNAAVNINTFRRSFNAYYASIPNSLLALYTDGNMPSADAARSMRQSFCDNLASKNNTLCEESLVLSRLVDSHFRVDPTAEITLPTRDITSLETFSFFPLGKSNRGVASLTDLGNVPKMPFSSDKGLQEVYDMLELFKKYQSPITQLPVSHLLSKLHGCLSSTSYYKELYGECLLQKILVLETVRSGDPHYKETVKSYLEWFDRLDKKTKNYEKLRDARDILIKMASVK